MPPWILALIPAVLGALAIVYVVTRPLARSYSEGLSDADLNKLIAGMTGFATVAMPITAMTPTKIDDDLVNKIVAAALDEFIRERGRRPRVSQGTIVDVARAVAVKQSNKSIVVNASSSTSAVLGTVARPVGPEARVR